MENNFNNGGLQNEPEQNDSDRSGYTRYHHAPPQGGYRPQGYAPTNQGGQTQQYRPPTNLPPRAPADPASARIGKRMFFFSNFRPQFGGDHNFSDGEVKSFRHSAEKPLYICCVVLNVLILLLIFFMILSDILSLIGTLASFDFEGYMQMSPSERDAYVEEYVEEILYGSEAASEAESLIQQYKLEIYIVVGINLLLTLVIVAYQYAQFRCNCVKLSYKDFPEVEAIVRRNAARLGINEIPEIYLYQSNGVMNAFSSFVIKKRYIVVYSPVFEVAYLEHHDMRALEFIICHELAHIRLHHADPWNVYTIMFSQLIPVIGPALVRAREYSCDRIAQQLTGDTGVRALLSLIAGKHLYARVNVEDYLEECERTNRSFFVFIYNMVSSHPVMSRRIPALLEPDRSGPLF